MLRDAGAGPLPRRVELIRGESVASFLWRLAERNGMTWEALIGRIGGPRSLTPADAELQEVRLGLAAQRLVAVACGRSVADLERALPSWSQGRVGARARQQVRVEAWPEGERPVQACTLCVAGLSGRPVWRVHGEQWNVCVRHGRWMGDGGRSQSGLEGLSEVVEAHERRVRLERRVGSYGRALLADAQQVAVYWWQCRQMGSRGVWRRRQEVLGVDRSALWAVGLVVYPEAVVVAECMAVRERQRAVGRSFAGGPAGWTTRRWTQWVGERLGMGGEIAEGGHRALEAWLVAHRNTVPVVRRLAQDGRPAARSVPMELLEPHRVVPSGGPLEQVSCLPWRLGSPMTSAGFRGLS